MGKSILKETELYAPVKAFFTRLGFDVKGEIGPCDLVAVREGEEPIIVELKTGFSLALVHQAIDRQRLTDSVYVAVPRPSGPAGRSALRRNNSLCRRLGIGMLTVRLRDGHVDVQCDPGPCHPRKSARRRAGLIKEFSRRKGDPNEGGSVRQRLITAYRQDALQCLALLAKRGPMRAMSVAAETGIANACRIMADNHHGWFDRVERGVYDTSGRGRIALKEYRGILREIAEADAA